MLNRDEFAEVFIWRKNVVKLFRNLYFHIPGFCIYILLCAIGIFFVKDVLTFMITILCNFILSVLIIELTTILLQFIFCYRSEKQKYNEYIIKDIIT